MAAALIFAATYLVLAFGRLPFLRVDRTGAAVVGAILMLVVGAVSLDEAFTPPSRSTLLGRWALDVGS